MKRSKEWFFYLPILLLFLGSLLLLPRASRYEDENIALLAGKSVYDAIFTKDPGTLLSLSVHDSMNGIGWPVCIPGFLFYKISGNLLFARIPMLLYSLFFWLTVLLYAKEFLKKFFQFDLKSFSAFYLFVFGFSILAIPQGLMNAYILQLEVLSEYPGLFYLFLSFYFLLKNRLPLAAFAIGLAGLCKFNYYFYYPFFLIVVAWKLKENFPLKKIKLKILKIAVCLISPIVFVQIVRFFAFGSEAYLFGWEKFIHWFLYTSGNGITNSQASLPPVNEWIHYSSRTKVHYLLGTFFPIAVAVFYLFKKSTKMAETYTLFLFSFFILLASSQWMFMAQYKWWRRCFYFVVPGYTLGAVFLLVLPTLVKELFKYRKLYYTALLVVCCWIFFRQTIYGTYENNAPLSEKQRTSIDWNDTTQLFNHE